MTSEHYFSGDKERLAGSDFHLTTGFVDVRVFPQSSNLSDLKDSVRNYIDDHMLDRRFPGGCAVTQEPSDKKPCINLYLDEASKPFITVQGDRDYQIAGWKELLLSRLPYLAYTLGERTRQKESNLFSLHAAAVSTPDNNGSILILGDKGSGKTSLALVLGLQGCPLIGNDLVLLKFSQEERQVFILAGTQIFDVRKAVIEKYFPQLASYVPYGSGYEPNHPYESKVVFLPEEIGISISGEGPKKLRLIVRINIHSNNSGITSTHPLDRTIEMLRLYENMSRYIRGVTTPFALTEEGIGGYFPSLDDEDMNNKRNSLINWLLGQIPFFYISAPTPDKAAFEVNRLITRL